MDIKVKVVWGSGMNDAKRAEFHAIRDSWGVLRDAINAGKSDPVVVANAAPNATYGGTRSFTDSTTANAWKTFVEATALQINVPVTVTVT
jgi:hypothetical protein